MFIVVSCVFAVIFSSILLVKFIVERKASGGEVWVFALCNAYVIFFILFILLG